MNFTKIQTKTGFECNFHRNNTVSSDASNIAVLFLGKSALLSEGKFTSGI